MYSLHPVTFQPGQRELSRHAAARYTVLTAVKERRSLQRRSSRSRKPSGPYLTLAAIDGAE
jgi:hypothetical protein